MTDAIIKQYKKTIEQVFRNMVIAEMINDNNLSIGNLPYVSQCLRAEEDLLEEIELNGLAPKHEEYLIKFIDNGLTNGFSRYPNIEKAFTGYRAFASGEILAGIHEMKQRLTEEKPSYKGYVLLHNYWSKYDKTKRITKTNAEKILSHYNLKSKGEMQKAVNFSIDEFLLFYDSDNKTIHHNKVDATIKQLNIIIPILEAQCPQAAEDARKDLEALERKRHE